MCQLCPQNNTSVTQSILSLIFLMYVATIRHLKYSGQLKKTKKKHVAVYDSDTSVTLEQGQGHQAWHALVDPTQSYNHAEFERPHLNSVLEKANVKGFVKSENTSVISPAYLRKSKIVVVIIFLKYLIIVQCFNLIG